MTITSSLVRRFTMSAALAIAAVSLPCAASAQAVTLPETAAGKVMKELIATAQQRDTAVVRKFVQSHMDAGFQEMPMEAHLENFANMRQELEGTRLAAVESHSDTHLSATYRAEKR